jgi:hypothetical protein
MIAAYTVIIDQTCGFAVEIDGAGNAIETVWASRPRPRLVALIDFQSPSLGSDVQETK